jgi:hypothetical protein
MQYITLGEINTYIMVALFTIIIFFICWPKISIWIDYWLTKNNKN